MSEHFTIVVHSVKSVDTFRAGNYFVVSLYIAVFEFGEVFCFTDFLSGFSFRVRVRVKVGVAGGFRVRVRIRASFRDR